MRTKQERNQRRAMQRKRAWHKRKYEEELQNRIAENFIHCKAFRDVSTLHAQLMCDLWYATHCHGCQELMHFVHNYCGKFCTKDCWRGSTNCNDDWKCSIPTCYRCISVGYEPTLANPIHIRIYYKMNPMGPGKNMATFHVWPTGDSAWQARHGWDPNIIDSLPRVTFPMIEVMGR